MFGNNKYKKGAVAAYKDCAEAVRHIRDNIVEDVVIKEYLTSLHESFMSKAEYVDHNL